MHPTTSFWRANGPQENRQLDIEMLAQLELELEPIDILRCANDHCCSLVSYYSQHNKLLRNANE